MKEYAKSIVHGSRGVDGKKSEKIWKASVKLVLIGEAVSKYPCPKGMIPNSGYCMVTAYASGAGGFVPPGCPAHGRGRAVGLKSCLSS
jgi:hypothetical protein